MPPLQTVAIRMVVRRRGDVVFEGSTSVSEMARTFDELIQWLGRENSFPGGAFLLTGTGIVPDSDFTLHAGDLVAISIEGIGVLINPIAQEPT
jgi:2-dehydro-3-deoxy-D-arabinonate dehydratase